MPLLLSRRVVGAMDASPAMVLQIIVVIAFLIGSGESLLIRLRYGFLDPSMMVLRKILSHSASIV